MKEDSLFKVEKFVITVEDSGESDAKVTIKTEPKIPPGAGDIEETPATMMVGAIINFLQEEFEDNDWDDGLQERLH